jgi:hypothetical protein
MTIQARIYPPIGKLIELQIGLGVPMLLTDKEARTVISALQEVLSEHSHAPGGCDSDNCECYRAGQDSMRP